MRLGTTGCRYYTPSILQLAGLSNQAALLLSMAPAATNALGTVVGMRCIDRFGRRRLLLSSIAAVVLALAALGGAFLAAERHSPRVAHGGGNATCAAAAALPDCTACLRHGCGFCGGGGGGGDLLAPGSCLALDPQQQQQGQQQQGQGQGQQQGPCPPPGQLFLHGCPSRYTWLILACLVAYLAAFSPGLGPVPWAVNAEIYPLAVRGVATGTWCWLAAAPASYRVAATLARCWSPGPGSVARWARAVGHPTHRSRAAPPLLQAWQPPPTGSATRWWPRPSSPSRSCWAARALSSCTPPSPAPASCGRTLCCQRPTDSPWTRCSSCSAAKAAAAGQEEEAAAGRCGAGTARGAPQMMRQTCWPAGLDRLGAVSCVDYVDQTKECIAMRHVCARHRHRTAVHSLDGLPVLLGCAGALAEGWMHGVAALAT